MREIKFRAWDKKKNKMIDYSWRMSISMSGEISWSVDEFNGKLQEIGHINEDATDRFILMQYTGLKDANNREIYEGDIMEYYSAMVEKGSNTTLRQLVVWDKRNCCFQGCFNGGIVLGNIHESPELLS